MCTLSVLLYANVTQHAILSTKENHYNNKNTVDKKSLVGYVGLKSLYQISLSGMHWAMTGLTHAAREQFVHSKNHPQQRYQAT